MSGKKQRTFNLEGDLIKAFFETDETGKYVFGLRLFICSRGYAIEIKNRTLKGIIREKIQHD